MRRVALYIGIGFLALILLCLAGLFWLFGTEGGARFALTALPAALGYRVSLQGVEGRLSDRLHLSGVRLSRPKLEVSIDTLDLSWEPRQLLERKLMLHELALAGVRIRDDRPPAPKPPGPPELRWPRVGQALRRVSAEITRLRLKGVSYRRLKAPPVVVDELLASVGYRNGLLSLSGLSLVTPQGRASGELAAGFWRPSLRADLSLVPARPIRKLDLFSLQARLSPGREPEQVSGPVAVAAKSGGKQRLELTAELGMTGNSFNVRRLRLSRPGRRGTLTGAGTMTLTETEPLFRLSLKATDLDLKEELAQATDLSGSVDFSGSRSSFKGSFALENKGPGWQSASLSAGFRGGAEGVKLAPLKGRLLDGSLSGALEVAWSDGVKVAGKLAGRGLNPARVAAGWWGVVNLDLAGEFRMPKRGEPAGKLEGRVLESRLQGRELRGEIKGGFAGKRVEVERLFLAGQGFDLRGSGTLDRRLALSARVSDLSGLLPGAAGRLTADGWLRWRDGLFSGAATGEGSDLAVAGTSSRTLRLEARLGEGKDHPLYLDLSLNRLRVGRLQAESALVNLQGSAASHRLKAELSSPQAELQMALSGGYGSGTWKGELTRLTGRDAVGPWSLAAPAPLVLSASRLRVAPLLLNGLPGERVALAGELDRESSTGSFRVEWGGIELARANAWLAGVELSGGSSGELDLRLLPGERLIVSGRADARGTLVADGHRVELERLAAALQGDGSGLRAALDLSLQGGSGEAHLLFSSPEPASLALPERGELRLQWSNLDLALLRPFTSADLEVAGRAAGLVTGRLLPGRRVDLKGNASLEGGRVAWRSQGDRLDASIETAELSFSRRGPLAAAGGELTLKASAAATGAYTSQGRRVAAGRLTLAADAGQGGTSARLDLSLEGGGALRASLSSDAPPLAGIPERANLALEWGGIDPALLKPWLPGAFKLEGNFAGQASGRLLPGKRLEMAGGAEFTQGRASWQGGAGEVNANLRSARLSFDWRDQTLTGDLTLALAQYGRAQGSFVLPIPARLPVVPDRNGAVQGTLTGKVQEHGLLTAFLPGLVQESHGDLDLDARVAGTWSEPSLGGSLALSRAGAYLPSAGITVSDLQLTARLQGDRVSIDNFRAVSGKGHIDGNMTLRLEGWQVAEYFGTVSGDRFQTVYLPELQMLTSPQISFKGDARSIILRGELRVPEMLVSGPPVRQIVTPSGDVVMEGAPPATEAKGFPLAVDGRIRVVLGDKVEVKASGIDALLGGSIDLVLKGVESISSSGEIRVIKGRYRAYGMDLEIVRGRVYYVNDPVDQPTLDILALRSVGDVRAGVTVAGSLKAPVVKLYSEPPMPEVDILAYMVLGHPLGASSEQGNMLATAASSLFSLGESSSVQAQIKDRLGLSVLGLESIDTSGAGLMGYKPVSVTPTGEAPAKPAASESLLTVGKYLTPELYISYGRSLVTEGNLFMLRYDITRHWQLETQSGTESGVDLYYKVEFN